MRYTIICRNCCVLYGSHFCEGCNPKNKLNSIYGRQATRKWATETKDKDDGKKKRV